MASQFDHPGSGDPGGEDRVERGRIDAPALPAGVIGSNFASDILSRLVAGGPASGPLRPVTESRRLEDRFCRALLDGDPEAALAHVDTLRRRGVSDEAIFRRHLVAAAHRLGEMWCDDQAHFVEVTLASAHLQRLIRRLSPDLPPLAPAAGRRALFVVPSGETHALGLMMAAEVFRRAGWDVAVEYHPDEAELCNRARVGRFDLVGVTSGHRLMMERLAALVLALRTVSPGHTRIVVGGAIVQLEPDLVDRLGIDMAITDAWAAVRALDFDESLPADAE
ncbi:MAG: cobalamin B12-binding domain-containing protein [Pseudomonadota bacterium]